MGIKSLIENSSQKSENKRSWSNRKLMKDGKKKSNWKMRLQRLETKKICERVRVKERESESYRDTERLRMQTEETMEERYKAD